MTRAHVSTARLAPGQFDRIAKALADPRRLKLLETIAADDEFACSRLCGCFPVTKATISHHVKELSRAGLVNVRREGQFMYLTACRSVLAAYAEELMERVSMPARALRSR